MILNFAQTIRKMMGWCPKVGAMETKKAVQFDDIVLNASDKGRELTHITMRWWNKYHNLILLISILGILTDINMLISWEKRNMDIFLAGLFLGILISTVTWKTTWHSLDRIATHTPHKTVMKLSKKRMLVFFIIIFLYVAAIAHFISIYDWRKVSAFLLGIGTSLLWLSYFQIVYWERKNSKTLIKSGYFNRVFVVSNWRQ